LVISSMALRQKLRMVGPVISLRVFKSGSP
jgi:hypothetical protein